jgi:predicted nucleic acid-binding protein
MELKYLWDTNTVIYYLQQQFGAEAEELMDEIAGNYQICISTITEIELYCWRTTNPEDLKVLSDFVADATVIELEKEIKFQTAEVRRRHRVKLPDAIIAATAQVHNLTLLTGNTKDFKQISGLMTQDPGKTN